MNKALLYVHFNKNDKLSEYVVYQLTSLRKLFKVIVFISNSTVSSGDKSRIHDICDKILIRPNSGYDFAAWRDGIKTIGWPQLSKFDSVTLMNDTCFGPVYPMNDVYSKMERGAVDFWGITNHAASVDGMPGSNGPIPTHIQSYLTVYSRKVIKSKTFQDFWNNVRDYQTVSEVIRKYETQLTGLLNREKFTHKVVFDTNEYSKGKNIFSHNYSELLPLVIINNSVPLLKIKSFRHTPAWLIKRQLRKTKYPLYLIDEHLKNIGIKSASFPKYYLKIVSVLLIRRMKMIYNIFNER
jgi:rhamnosyltransferase